MVATRSSMFPRLRSGDEGEWRTFMEVYQPIIAHLARRSGLSGDDVDEIVQQVVVQFHETLPRFDYDRRRGCFRAWLRRVTVNKIRDRFRRRRSVSLAENGEHLAMAENEEDWDHEFRVALIRCGLKSISSEFRPRTWQCFEEHVLRCRSAAEVSGELALSQNAVYINSCRVLARMREFCAQHGEDIQNVQMSVPDR